MGINHTSPRIPKKWPSHCSQRNKMHSFLSVASRSSQPPVWCQWTTQSTRWKPVTVRMVRMGATDITSYIENLRNRRRLRIQTGLSFFFLNLFFNSTILYWFCHISQYCQTTNVVKQTDRTLQNTDAKNSHLVSVVTVTPQPGWLLNSSTGKGLLYIEHKFASLSTETCFTLVTTWQVF